VLAPIEDLDTPAEDTPQGASSRGQGRSFDPDVLA
jgi:hypothetical protein